MPTRPANFRPFHLPSRAVQKREADERRAKAQLWRSWYKTARWQALRLRVFQRDHYICQRTGALLTGRHPAPNSPVADHKVPHRGIPALFWDERNIETVAKQYHDSVKQSDERRA